MVQRNLKCYNCKTFNCQEVDEQRPDLVMWCKNCGFAQNPDPEKLKKLNDPNPGNWLPCIPLKGVVARIPLGETPDGYDDPVNGGSRFYTREEYMKTFFIDPEIYLDFARKRGRPTNVTGFECAGQAVPSTKIVSAGDDPKKLKQDQLAGRINRVEYLEKLMGLLKGGKVTQELYDAEKKRILKEMV